MTEVLAENLVVPLKGKTFPKAPRAFVVKGWAFTNPSKEEQTQIIRFLNTGRVSDLPEIYQTTARLYAEYSPAPEMEMETYRVEFYEIRKVTLEVALEKEPEDLREEFVGLSMEDVAIAVAIEGDATEVESTFVEVIEPGPFDPSGYLPSARLKGVE